MINELMINELLLDYLLTNCREKPKLSTGAIYSNVPAKFDQMIITVHLKANPHISTLVAICRDTHNEAAVFDPWLAG